MKKVLCVCIGNSDRSPVMAAVLGKFLEGKITCESAGVGETAQSGKPAPYGVAAARRIGIDISNHSRRHISALDLRSYDLIVCASDEIAARVIEAGADMKKIYNAQIPNPWPVQFQEDYDAQTMPAILAGMYRVVCRYFT